MTLSLEYHDFVLNNMGLVYCQARRYGVTPNSSEYDDIVSSGKMGLINATLTYDPSKGVAFSTYAVRCIKNEMLKHFQASNRYSKNISLYDPIADLSTCTFQDIIADPNSNFVKKILDKAEIICVINIILNCLYGKHRIALLYFLGDERQRAIGKIMNLSQRYISMLQAQAIEKVRKFLKTKQIHSAEVFSVAIKGDEYRISFSPRNVDEFNNIFEGLLQKMTSVGESPYYKINRNGKEIILWLPAIPESFSFLAQIVQEIEKFGMSFVSNAPQASADETVTKKASPQLPNANNENRYGRYKRGDVLNYIATQDHLTAKDLRKRFPDLSQTQIDHTLLTAKRIGLITATSRGKYAVNKN